MAENSLVVSSHGLSATELASWFSEHHCELASCRKTGAVELSDECLVELVLENSTDIAEHVFISNFPSGTVRRVCPSEHHDDSLQANVFLTHCLGGVDVKINLRGGEVGGTGMKLWPGGILLADWLCHNGRGILEGLDVLELGAGVAALPSLAAAQCGARRVVASDGLAGIVAQLEHNLSLNSSTVEVRLFDWATAMRRVFKIEEQFDVVLFADGLYSPRGALFLAEAATALLRESGGVVLGALPCLRAGVRSFEQDMQDRGFDAIQLELDTSSLSSASSLQDKYRDEGVVVDEELEGHRVVMWRSDG